ncbi:PREDICTED: cytochrome b561 and DOMON domain-containing protein At3g61750 [Nelumbo nucifera]|uniref:Cytochrome b561 and DOMON domain-containing protein At3g61750 n=1 Tax=Nelumbo nucifera TaxID=4432 RepID=A0A1U8AG03_NELNU|nr:PREDICTED: cytochrome b561 and DOMON domain-containing protein At3g61750 [Nelumbo nucifera]
MLPPRFFRLFAALVLLLEAEILPVVADGDGLLEACKQDLNSFLPPPYGNYSGYTCTTVWNTFILRYTQSQSNVLTIVLSAVYTTGWVGIGFSKDGTMVGSSAMVGWINKEGRAKIKQYYLRGQSTSEVIPDKGELQLTNVPTVTVLHEATIYLAFQLNLATPLTHQQILLAFGTLYPMHNRLTKHDDKTTVVFDFSAPGSPAVIPKNTNNLKRSHGVLGITAWGVILPAGAIVARYYKHRDPLWYYIHTFVQFVGFIIGLATVVAGKALYDGLHVNIPAHRGIGIFVLVLSILQVIAFFLRPNKEAKKRKYWNWYHHWVGRLALFFGAVNIVLGIQVGGAGSSWKVAYGFFLAVVLITVIVLEVLLWKRGSEKNADPPTFQSNPN